MEVDALPLAVREAIEALDVELPGRLVLPLVQHAIETAAGPDEAAQAIRTLAEQMAAFLDSDVQALADMIEGGE